MLAQPTQRQTAEHPILRQQREQQRREDEILLRQEKERQRRRDVIRALFDHMYKESFDPITGHPQWTSFCQQLGDVVKNNAHPTVSSSVVWLEGFTLASTCVNQLSLRKTDYERAFPPEQKADPDALLKFLDTLLNK